MTASDGVSPSPKGGPESARTRLNPPLSKGVYVFGTLCTYLHSRYTAL